MADQLVTDIVAVTAPKGTIPLVIPKQTFSITLQPLPTQEQINSGNTIIPSVNQYTLKPQGGVDSVLINEGYYDKVTPSTAILQPSISVPKPKVDIKVNKKVIVWDIETSGTDLFSSRVILCSMWDINKPKSELVRLFAQDEEELYKEIAAYFNEEKPDIIVGYNISFELRFAASRMMRYQIQCPGLWNAVPFEEMDIGKKGTMKSLSSTQASGTLEEWETYLFNDTKPYTIEECFEGLRQGRITELYIRNSLCTTVEGDLYKAYIYTMGQDEESGVWGEVVTSEGQLKHYGGIRYSICQVCKQRNEWNEETTTHNCFVCGARLPTPDESKKEEDAHLGKLLPELDVELPEYTGPKPEVIAAKKTTTTATTATKKKVTAPKTIQQTTNEEA